MSHLLYVSDVAPYVAMGGRTPAGVHRSLWAAGRALEEVAGLNGLGFHHAERVGVIPAELLMEARVLALFTIGETQWSKDQREMIEARVAEGDLALLGLHSASDSAYQWAAFGELLGARFAGHPVTAELPVAVVDRRHPATSHLPSKWMFEEELYLFRDLAPDARVLLGVRPQDLSGPVQRRLAEAIEGHSGLNEPELLPLAWCIERGKMRSFYSVLGHFLSAYEDPRYVQHLSGAVEWLLGVEGACAG